MPSLLKKPIFWLITLPLFAALTWLVMLPDRADTLAPLPDPAAYSRIQKAKRTQKDSLLRYTADSPITDKSGFRGLPYFGPDPAFRVMAQLEPFPEGNTEKLVVTLTDGTKEVYEKYAHANFILGGKSCRLLVLRFQKALTVLFQDATSGQETYGGGRYLDLDPGQVQNNQIVLDFNEAYSPYCAYNPGYACPLPPPENKLPVAIRAGEQYAHVD